MIVPKKKESEVFKRITKRLKVKIFFGPENNLVERHLLAAEKFKGDVIVRVPGDNCFSEPKEIDKIIKYHLKFKNRSFTSNLTQIGNSGYPDGLGAEVFDYDTLKIISKMNLSKKRKEHLSLNFYDYKKQKVINKKFCKVNTLKCPKEYAYPNVRLDVNTEKDYLFIKEIYDKLFKKKQFLSIYKIISYLKNIKKLKKII